MTHRKLELLPTLFQVIYTHATRPTDTQCASHRRAASALPVRVPQGTFQPHRNISASIECAHMQTAATSSGGLSGKDEKEERGDSMLTEVVISPRGQLVTPSLPRTPLASSDLTGGDLDIKRKLWCFFFFFFFNNCAASV